MSEQFNFANKVGFYSNMIMFNVFKDFYFTGSLKKEEKNFITSSGQSNMSCFDPCKQANFTGNTLWKDVVKTCLIN